MSSRPGAYGLALTGVDGAAHLLPSAQEGDQPLHVILAPWRPWSGQHVDDDDHLRCKLVDEGSLALDRAARTATFVIRPPVDAEDVAHPLLAAAAATFCRWDGFAVLHGGVVARDGRALAVVGEQEAGKSSLLGWIALHRDDLDILADDLVVIRDGVVRAGPRSIDLRPGAAAALPLTTSAVSTRNGSRTRLRVRPGPTSATIHDVVVLTWGTQLGLVQVPVSERLRVLHSHTTVRHDKASAARLLALIELRVWVLTRPASWEQMAHVVDHVIAAVLDE